MHPCIHARMQPKLPGIIVKRARSPQVADKEPLQVRIPAHVKRRFKAHAALRGIEPNELFVEVWNHYESAVITVSQSRGDKE